MELSVAERILLLDVLPNAEGPFLFLRAIRKLREDLGFSETETAEIGLKIEDKMVTWDQTKNPMKDVNIGPVAAKYISDSIMAAPRLREEQVPFYARFVREEI